MRKTEWNCEKSMCINLKKKEDEIGSNVVVRKILQCHCYIVLCCTQHSNGNNIKHLFKYSPNIKEIECNKIESMLPEKQ